MVAFGPIVRRWVVLCLALAAAVPQAVADGKKKPVGGPEYAVVGGTVFRDNGFALADAEVTLEIVPDAGSTGSKSKVKKLKSTTSPRGEFTFRVPAAPAKYRVAVSMKGFRPGEKMVEIQGGPERVDATFSLSPESKQ